MKAAVQFLLLSLVTALSACSGGGGKFAGRWHITKGIGDHNRVVIIERKGDHYDCHPETSPQEFLSFTYDKDHDVLTVNDRNETIDIKYDDSSHHLIMGSRGGHQFLELEAVK